MNVQNAHIDWMSVADFYAAIKHKTDAEWEQMLLKSVADPVVNGVLLPVFPGSDLQTETHGHSGEVSMRESIAYFNEVRNYAAFAEHPVHEERVLLDFGAGWGRISRPWMRSVHPSNIIGFEPNPRRVAQARSCNPYVTFIHTNPLPPSRLADESVDYVVAFSVFSHLDEYSTRKWFAEYRRILKPGGIIAVTTQGQGFIDVCKQFRDKKKAGEALGHPWHEALAASFTDVDQCRAMYQNGDFLFATQGRMPRAGARYGEAIISPAFVRKHLCDRLDFIDYFDDKGRLAQALIVVQKPKS